MTNETPPVADTIDDTELHGYLAVQLGEALSAARGDASRRATAQRLDLAGNTLRELELGLANPTLRRVEEVAALYGLEIAFTVRPRTPRE